MSTTTRQRRPVSRTERATALILVPTMMLVLVALGAIAIDLSVVHLAHRSIHRVVSSAADDAAGMIDTRQIQIDGSVRIDPSRAARTVSAHIETATLPGTLRGRPQVVVADDGLSLTVSAEVEVPHILMRSMPGASASEIIRVTVTARILP